MENFSSPLMPRGRGPFVRRTELAQLLQSFQQATRAGTRGLDRRTECLVQNDTEEDLDEGSVLRLANVLVGPSDGDDDYRLNTAYRGALISSDADQSFCILQEPAAAADGALARAVYSGVVLARLTGPTGQPSATPKEGETTLEAAASGPCAIIFDPGGEEERMAIVRIGGSGKGTNGQDPGAPTGGAEGNEIDCDCNRLVIGQPLDCDVCPCGNLYRFIYFGTIKLPNASPTEPPVVWTASGGQKRFRHIGGCVSETPNFSHPVCSTDKYVYRMTLTAAEDEGGPPKGTIVLVRVEGSSCPEISATWCLYVKGGCGFECYGVWQFQRERPWGNLLPSSLSCSLCVTPKYPKKKPTDLTDANCACGAIIKLPLKFHGPGATLEQLAAHGIEGFTFSHWLGWRNLWELTYPTNTESFGGQPIPDGGGSADVCNPSHVQARGTATIGEGGPGNSFAAVWNAEGFIIEEEDDTVTLSVLCQIHLEGVDEDYSAYWSRVFSINLTCAEYFAAIATGYADLPETEHSDAEGTYPGGDDVIRLMLNGDYPKQDEPTSSDQCGEPDADDCTTKKCQVKVVERARVGGTDKYFQAHGSGTCLDGNCQCLWPQALYCGGENNIAPYIDGLGWASDYDVDEILDVPCGEGPPGEGATPGEAATFQAGGDVIAMGFVLYNIGGVWTGTGTLSGGPCDGQPITLELSFEGGCPHLYYDISAGTYAGHAAVAVISESPFDLTVTAIAGCGPFSITLTEVV